jgi:hypothetical protein
MTASIVRNVKLAQDAPEGSTKLGKFKSKQEWNGMIYFEVGGRADLLPWTILVAKNFSHSKVGSVPFKIFV